MKSLILTFVTHAILIAAAVAMSVAGSRADDYFTPLTHREGPVTQADIDTYWQDFPDLLNGNASVATAQMTTTDGRGLAVSMLRDSTHCTLNDCLVRIYEDGQRIAEHPACRDIGHYAISKDGDYIRVCGMTYAIADWRDVQPRRARNTIPYWQGLSDDSAMNHNGSSMRVLPAQGKIIYIQPRAGMGNSIKSGQVLFEGRPWTPGEAFSGTAYTFRKGCSPAPYRVEAFYEGANETLTLRGAAPVREKSGCKVTGYSLESSNAALAFSSTFD